MKEILFDQKARELMLSGVEKLNQAVSSTLGAKGRHVIIQQGNQYAVTKDGVTVANNFELPDPVENAAASIVKDAAARTARDAGDGTTSSTVLAYNAISHSMRLISSKANPMDLKRGMDKAAELFIDEINKSAIPVETTDDIKNIATISANNDPKLGNMIAGIFEKVGKSGAIRLEETGMNETVVDIIEGCQINAGMISPNFITNQNKRVADYSNPVIFITDKKFENSFNELIPILTVSQEFAKPLVIICGGMEGEPLGTLVINKIQKKFPVVAITAPEFGENRMEILDDIAAMTGATVVSEARGFHIDEVSASQFGRADRIVVAEKTTTIIGRLGTQEAIDARVEVIKQQQDDDKNGNQAWRLSKRMASLTSGIGVIYVGGNSDTEMKESYYRLEDALAATKAALDEGYVPGGGMAYVNGARALSFLNVEGNKDFKDGFDVVLKTLLSPMETIVTNCGESPAVITDRIERMERESAVRNVIGYNALTGYCGNMIDMGIIDPAKVVKSALRNAISVAGMIITTNCTIVNEVKK